MIIAASCAKKFKCNPYLGMSIAAALLYPAMVGLETTGTLFEGTLMALDYKTTFLGIPVVYPKSGYASSVVPILVATGVGAKLEKYFKKIVPDTLKLFFVPFFDGDYHCSADFYCDWSGGRHPYQPAERVFPGDLCDSGAGRRGNRYPDWRAVADLGYLRSALGGYPDRNCQYQYIWKRFIHDSLLCGFVRAVYGSCGYLY